eukprot:5626952-Pyramimonas_sp.AAC.1
MWVKSWSHSGPSPGCLGMPGGSGAVLNSIWASWKKHVGQGEHNGTLKLFHVCWHIGGVFRPPGKSSGTFDTMYLNGNPSSDRKVRGWWEEPTSHSI